MASLGLTASLQRACTSNHITRKQSSQARATKSLLGTKQSSNNVVVPNVDGLKAGDKSDRAPSLAVESPMEAENRKGGLKIAELVGSGFSDARWKNGTWDLNMFVKNGRMDWDAVIVAEAKRRKFLEQNPEASTNEEPVLFRSSIIPWWAWIMHSHLPEAELLNGRAAMLGFFVAYFVDSLTGLDLVGQTGNFICKIALFVTIIGVILFRKKDDLENFQKLADEATFYDKQWQASWKTQDSGNGPRQ